MTVAQSAPQLHCGALQTCCSRSQDRPSSCTIWQTAVGHNCSPCEGEFEQQQWENTTHASCLHLQWMLPGPTLAARCIRSNVLQVSAHQAHHSPSNASTAAANEAHSFATAAAVY